MLGPVVKAETAGEEPVAVRDLEEVARLRAPGGQRAGRRIMMLRSLSRCATTLPEYSGWFRRYGACV